jgi:hypothetical protein
MLTGRFMAETIKTITDRGQFEEIFNKFFSNRDVYIKTKSGDLAIQFLGYSSGNVAFRIPRVKNVPDSIVVLTRLGENTIYASLKSLEGNEDTFIFLPIKIQIISEARREERTSLGSGEGKSILFATNLISESMIQHALDSNEKKIILMKEKIAADLRGKFNRVRVVFMNESRIDPRMKHFMGSWNPIFMKEIGKEPSEADKKDVQIYLSEIYAKDYKLSSQKEYISEVSVPFVYKNMIPYGYIQVNNTKPMDENHLTVIKRLASMINDQLVKDNIFATAKDKFIVTDVSKKGLGIVFKDRRLMRYFIKDTQVVIELNLPDSNKATMGVTVRNTIFNDSGTIRVGFEITTIDAISEVNYDEFLETLKKDQ